TLDALAVARTALWGGDLVHMERLVSSWRHLADLSFADLLLLAPITGEEGHRFVILAQVRPVTGQTNYPQDLVGTVVDEVERPLLARSWRAGELVEADAHAIGAKERVRVQCIPVRRSGKLIALLTREASVTFAPHTGELERDEISILLRVMPLFEDDDPTGALLLMRDVSDLRRRDRMLLSKDATIREIHHRVKNNLQTIASLLRLQARRLHSPEGRAALVESERRIRSIAIVHDTLSPDAGDVVR